MGIRNNIAYFTDQLKPKACSLIAVSKTQPVEKIQEAYDAGQRLFGENKVQELETKYESTLPRDIEWHMIGHLQRNKVKYIAPFVGLIHSVDSQKLLEEVNKQGEKCGRIIPCLIQIYIAHEETKFGLLMGEMLALMASGEIAAMNNIRIEGLMGMATLTDDQSQVRSEFKNLKSFFDQLKSRDLPKNMHMKHLSMGMSGDYHIALEEGSTMVRIGTAIFGERQYTKS